MVLYRTPQAIYLPGRGQRTAYHILGVIEYTRPFALIIYRAGRTVHTRWVPQSQIEVA